MSDQKERAIKRAQRAEIPKEAAAMLGDDFDIVEGTDFDLGEQVTEPSFDQSPQKPKQQPAEPEKYTHPVLKKLKKSFGLPTTTSVRECEVGDFVFGIRPLHLDDLTWIMNKSAEFATVAANVQGVVASQESSKTIAETLVAALCVAYIKVDGTAYASYEVFGLKPTKTELAARNFSKIDPPASLKFRAAEKLYLQYATEWKHGVSEAVYSSYSRHFDKENRVQSGWMARVFSSCVSTMGISSTVWTLKTPHTASSVEIR